MTLAHDAVGPSELWSSWRPDPIVVAALLLTAVLYRQGLAGLRARRLPTVGPSQVAAFAAGLLALAVALASPLEAAASSLFSAHMVQHLVLLVVAAPLLAAGRPGLVLAAGLPDPLRRPLRRTRARRPVRRAAAAATHPLAVWAGGTVVLWAWHLPALYQSAVRDDAVHALEHGTLVVAAGLLWAAVLGTWRRPQTAPAAVLLLFATGLQGAALGAVLTLAQSPLYPVHGPFVSQWGLTPLEDQQLAGGLMWVPPGLVYLTVAACLLVRWFAALGAAAEPPAGPPAVPTMAKEGT